jgi:hypothetical protein
VDAIVNGEVFARLRETESGLATLYSFEGTVGTDGRDAQLKLDFRVYADGTREIRFPGEGGDVIVGLDANQREILRDSVDSWACEIEQLSCTSLGNGTTIAVKDVPR